MTVGPSPERIDDLTYDLALRGKGEREVLARLLREVKGLALELLHLRRRVERLEGRPAKETSR